MARGKIPGRSPSRRSGKSRTPLARITYIHDRVKLNRYPNCNRLAEELGVAARTVRRDIDFMRDNFLLPIAYDEVRHGYYYTEPVSDLPLFQVTEGELLALFVAHKSLEVLRGTSFEQKMNEALQKFSQMLGDTISLSWTELDHAFSVRKPGVTKADLRHFELLSKAVLKRCEVEFQYRKLNAAGPDLRCVQPCHLGNVDNLWYLFAFDLDRGEMRTFALQRMQKVKITRRKFNRPEFSIEKHLEGSFGVFQDGKGTKETVRIRFNPFAAQLVRERNWHPSQKIKELPDGELELSLALGNLFEVERWVLSWGRHAEVLAPSSFRKQIGLISKELASRY